MIFARMKSEAQIYSAQSSGANQPAHQCKQILIQEQQINMGLDEGRIEAGASFYFG